MSDLFPNRARIGSTPYGLDADHADHRQKNAPEPELTVTDAPLVLWSPDGRAWREVGKVHFGFHGKDDDDCRHH